MPYLTHLYNSYIGFESVHTIRKSSFNDWNSHLLNYHLYKNYPPHWLILFKWPSYVYHFEGNSISFFKQNSLVTVTIPTSYLLKDILLSINILIIPNLYSILIMKITRSKVLYIKHFKITLPTIQHNNNNYKTKVKFKNNQSVKNWKL